MGLSRATIRKINEALKSAFPNRDELVIMLSAELDISESEVPDDSSYELVIANLVNQLEYQGRIRELIKGALNKQPSHPDLQEIFKEVNAVFSNLSGSQPLKWFEFDVMTVDAQGWKISRKKRQAQYFAEDLGNGIFLEMVAISGGIVMMDATTNKKWSTEDKQPQHQVTVSPFFMSKYPITQSQWRAVAELPQVNKHLNPDPSFFKGDNRPAEQITWYDAVEFCDRLHLTLGRQYRLPSEAEWEYACRAGMTTQFFFGENITMGVANNKGNPTLSHPLKVEERQETLPVGSFPPNAFGLYDMHGNVWEWCADTWPHDKGAPTDGSEWIENEHDNQSWTVCGGSWYIDPDSGRPASCIRYGAGSDFINDGFRVVCRT